jgi:DNA polymerase-3 subunit epsilon
MRRGEVVDRWQSLINPERSIPRFITELTGISNEMVADAPVFAEIADSFQEFMGEAIFVAHNVRFDHGFLAAEYERLERRFRYPQLCTCQSMRSLFKGLPSYSLGKLCRHFDIPLESHHRALCDAEAAAGLLVLINEKRMAAG